MGKIQIIKCNKCGVTFAACCAPECYTDKDWQKDVANYVKKGYDVDLIESGNGLTLEKCKCNLQLSLF